MVNVRRLKEVLNMLEIMYKVQCGRDIKNSQVVNQESSGHSFSWCLWFNFYFLVFIF